MNATTQDDAGVQVRKNVFLTGLPGVGKTTIIREVLRLLDIKATGFYTSELRERDERVAFAITTLDGREGLLARVGLRGKHRVGRYVVNDADLDRVAVPSLIPSSPSQLIVIDEIGKMECFSARFREAVLRALEGPNPVLGTIAMKGGGFIAEVRSRPDVGLHHVTPTNRDVVPRLVSTLLRPMTERG